MSLASSALLLRSFVFRIASPYGQRPFFNAPSPGLSLRYLQLSTPCMTSYHFNRSFTNMAAPIERLCDNLETPALDDRKYRVIRLSNKLEALLVHDPETDKASAAVNVNVGSFSDADDMPGLAHAVEHALFMGTEKVHVLHPQALSQNTILTRFSSIRSKMPIANISPPTLDTPTPIPRRQKQIISSRLELERRRRQTQMALRL